MNARDPKNEKLVSSMLKALAGLTIDKLASIAVIINRSQVAGVKHPIQSRSLEGLYDFFDICSRGELGKSMPDISESFKNNLAEKLDINYLEIQAKLSVLSEHLEDSEYTSLAQYVNQFYEEIKAKKYESLASDEEKEIYENQLMEKDVELSGKIKSKLSECDDNNEQKIKALLRECRKYMIHLADDVQKELDKNKQDYALKYGLSRLCIDSDGKRKSEQPGLSIDLLKDDDVYKELEKDNDVPDSIKDAVKKYRVVYHLRSQLLDINKNSNQALQNFSDVFNIHHTTLEARRADSKFVRTIKNILAFIPEKLGIKMFEVTGDIFSKKVSSLTGQDKKPGHKK